VDPPFPILTAIAIAVVNLMNTASYLMTSPMVPFMILSFFRGQGEGGKDLSELEVGYWSGLLEASFHVGSIAGAVFWGWFSDTAGRRPALLLGLLGTIFATLWFGLSTSFWSAMGARVAWGALNGNVGVAKTVLTEIVPDKHSARAFSWLGINTGFGRLIGPAMGGLLSEPARKYGWTGPGDLFVHFPFLLPCIVASAMTSAVMVLSFFTVPETLHLSLAEAAANRTRLSAAAAQRMGMESGAKAAAAGGGGVAGSIKGKGSGAYARIEQNAGEESEEEEEEEDEIDVVVAPSSSSTVAAGAKGTSAPTAPSAAAAPGTSAAPLPLPLPPAPGVADDPRKEPFFTSMRRLMKDGPVYASTVLYSLLGLVGLVSNEVYPLYVLADARHGGFSLDSSALGLIAFSAGPLLILFQALLFERIVKRLGLMRVQRINLALFAVLLATTPLQSLALPLPETARWFVLLLHFNLITICRVACFICVFIVVANSALPEDRGKVNGLGQALVSLVRAVGPPIWTAIFAWSVGPDADRLGWPFDFTLAWNCQAVMALVTLWWTYRLPSWIEEKRKDGLGGKGGKGKEGTASEEGPE
jgi:MFS family permease